MTQPVEPNLDPSQPPVASPAGQLNADDEIRQLATALAPPDKLTLTGHKATVTAVSLGDATTPPSVTIDYGGISIPSVAVAANYSPQIGDTVVLVQQLNQYVAVFRIAEVGSKSTEAEGGWTEAGLNAAHDHNGSQTVMYRRINDHGSWKMQWKGTLSYGGVTSLLASALAADFRPSVNRQTPLARSVTGTLPAARIDWNTDGTATFFGLSLSSGSNGSHQHYLGTSDTRLSGYLSQGGSDLGHAHGLGYSDTLGSHSHTIASDPPWISMDGTEYFL
jgi:hypothetical protein